MTDAELLESYRATRDRAVLDSLFARHYPTVYHVVLKMVRNATDANDITQSAFLKALEAADTVRPTGSLRNWLLAIAVNEVRQFKRSAARRNRPGHLQELARKGEAAVGQEGEVQRREFEEHLEQALQQFPDELKEPLVLHYYQNLSYSEMAEVLAIPRSTVQFRMDQALEKLREQFRKRGAFALFAAFLPRRPVLLGLTAMKLKLVATALVLLCCLLPFAAGVWKSRRLARPESPEPGASAAAKTSPRGAASDARPPVSDGAAIFGRVLDKTTEAPVAGAMVAVYNVEEGTTDRTATDDKGAFRLPSTRGSPAVHQLRITAKGYAALSAPFLEASEEPRTYHLSSGGTLLGRVEDVHGVPLHSFRISAVREGSGDQSYDPVRSLYLSALPPEWLFDEDRATYLPDGRFELRNVAPGAISLVVLTEGAPPFLAPPLFSEQNGYPLKIQEGITTEIRIVRPALGTIRVRVTDTESREPIPGAKVITTIDAGSRRFDVQREVLTDGSGLCTIPVFQSEGAIDSTWLSVRKEGYSSRRASFGGQDDGSLREVALGKPARLHGRVQAPDGTPIERAAVYVQQDADSTIVKRVFTDARGEYAVDMLDAPERYQVHVFDRALQNFRSTVAIVLREGENRELHFGMPGEASIAGTVTWNGVPVRGASVGLRGETDRYGMTIVYTNSRGEFRLEGLEPGSYKLNIDFEATSPGGRLIRQVTVQAQKCTEVHIKAGGFRMRGTVLDADGLRPFNSDSWAEMIARRIDGGEPQETATALVHRDGTFEVQVSNPGIYLLSVGDSYDYFADGPPARVDLTSRSSVDDLRILLRRDQRDRSALLRLVDEATGEPVLEGLYEYDVRSVRGAGSFEDGIIRNPEAPVGPYTVRVTTKEYVPAPVTFELTADHRRVEKTVPLRKADAVLVGSVPPSSAAEKAGLRTGDVILSYDGRPILNTPALELRAGKVVPTQKVPIEVQRGGETRVLLIPGGELGIELENTIRRIH